MVSATVSALDAAKSEAKVLLSKRDDLEHELEAEMSQLKATGAGEHGSLVDTEGYPRADAFEVGNLHAENAEREAPCVDARIAYCPNCIAHQMKVKKYKVRELRQKIDRLKNDLRSVNSNMESAMHRAHAAARGG